MGSTQLFAPYRLWRTSYCCVLSLGKAVEQFTGHCKLLAATPRYAEAIDLITQAERVLVASYEELLRKAQLMGQTVFKDALKADPVFGKLVWMNGVKVRLQNSGRSAQPRLV